MFEQIHRLHSIKVASFDLLRANMVFKTVDLSSSPQPVHPILGNVVLLIAFLAVLYMFFKSTPGLPRSARKKQTTPKTPEQLAHIAQLKAQMVDPPGLLWTLKLRSQPSSLKFDELQKQVNQGQVFLTQLATKRIRLDSTTIPTIQEQLQALADKAMTLSLAYASSSSYNCWFHFAMQLIVLVCSSTEAASGLNIVTSLSQETILLILPIVITLASAIDNLLELEKTCTIDYNQAIDLQRLHDQIYAQLAPDAPAVDWFAYYQQELNAYSQLLMDNSLTE